MSDVSAQRMTTQKLTFGEELRQQRWDDHRYYHHSRINQSLHLFSAICFLTTYALLAVNPSAAALLGWILAMCSRQIGHFFFEPKSYDETNDASHDHKEAIKIGYNLARKRVLHAIWAGAPVALYFNPTLFGLIEPYRGWNGFVYQVSMFWLWLAVAALLFRTVHLFFIHSVQTGLVWATKILTDPLHDLKTYIKSPLYLMRGELLDPMYHVRHPGGESDDEEDAPAIAH